MTPENYVRAQLAQFSISEAMHYGGVDNMAAVAHVIRNRVMSGWYAGEWMPVLEEAGMMTGTIVKPPESVNMRDMNLRVFLVRVDEIYLGREADMINGGLYYAELHNVNRDWFKKHILAKPEDHPRVATVGQVTFFR